MLQNPISSIAHRGSPNLEHQSSGSSHSVTPSPTKQCITLHFMHSSWLRPSRLPHPLPSGVVTSKNLPRASSWTLSGAATKRAMRQPLPGSRGRKSIWKGKGAIVKVWPTLILWKDVEKTHPKDADLPKRISNQCLLPIFTQLHRLGSNAAAEGPSKPLYDAARISRVATH